MLVLVSTLLDIARLESAGMPLKKSLCDLRSLMADAVNRVKSVADLKRLQIKIQSAPVTLIADRELIVRVIMNLVANAVRFAPEGTSVIVNLVSDDQEVKIEVVDEGPGIAEELQAKVFDKFTQGGGRANGGVAGLGLTFCRLAVEAHGGVIGVDSPVKPEDAKQPGSRFWFRLPRRA
jgi:signal transduction histidine kinase